MYKLMVYEVWSLYKLMVYKVWSLYKLMLWSLSGQDALALLVMIGDW